MRLEVSAADAPTVTGDPERLRQAVGNLVTNALRATPSGGLITLCAKRIDDAAVIEVADTGIGIAAEDLSHVFDRFWRADAARSRETGGRELAIAIAIAKEIISAHGGTITAQSTPGAGSVFTVRLPQAP